MPKALKPILDAALDMSRKARMERAREMGFDTERVLYHGTAADVSSFDPRMAGSSTKAASARMGTWLTDRPEVAGGYARFAAEDVPVQRLIDQSMAAERRGDWDKASELMAQAEALEQGGSLAGAGGQNILPLRARGRFMEVDAEGQTLGQLDDRQLSDWAAEAKAQGLDGLKVRNFVDNVDYADNTEADHYLIFDPANIRSVNAAFDPAKRDSSNLLAGVGGAAVGAGLLAPQEADAAPMGTLARQLGKRTREAWHGSPHVYDQVDLSRMGTGEGAQAYGAGYYAADARSLAETYRDKLSGGVFRGRVMVDGSEFVPANAAEGRAYAVIAKDGRASAQQILRAMKSEGIADPEDIAAYERALRQTKGKAVEWSEGSSALYRLEIPDEDLLDWDAPLSEQPEAVKKIARERGYLIDQAPEDVAPLRAAEEISLDDWDRDHWQSVGWKYGVKVGEELDGDPIWRGYGSIQQAQEAQAAIGAKRAARDAGVQGQRLLAGLEDEMGKIGAARHLSEAGIPGIRYLDGASRNAGEGTRNYVIFDDANVNVVERNGEPIAAMPRGREEPMSAAAGFARPGMMAAAGAGGALAEFTRRRQGKPRPYRQLAAEASERILAGRTRDSITALPDNWMTRTGQYLTEDRPSEMGYLQRALQRTDQLQSFGDWLTKTGQGDRTTALENLAAGLDVSPI